MPNPAQIVVAVPAAPESTCREFAGLVDDVVCASMPTPFLAVGESYWDFSQVSDDEVRELLATPTTGVADSAPHREHRAKPSARRRSTRPRWRAADGSARRADRRCADRADRRGSHGTHEFYEARAEITKWLIEQKGFTAVAAEADWPDAYRVNRYVRGLGEDPTAERGAARIRTISRVDVAQRRGSRLRRLAARAQRGARGQDGEPKPVSTAWICTACTVRCRR